jgi:hypothetical protein
VAASANTNHPPHVPGKLWQLFKNGSRTSAVLAHTPIEHAVLEPRDAPAIGSAFSRGRPTMPKDNDLEGMQDQGGKHGGQAGVPKPPPRPADTKRDKDTPKQPPLDDR